MLDPQLYTVSKQGGTAKKSQDVADQRSFRVSVASEKLGRIKANLIIRRETVAV